MEFFVGIVVGYWIFKWREKKYISREEHQQALKDMQKLEDRKRLERIDRYLAQHGLDFDP